MQYQPLDFQSVDSGELQAAELMRERLKSERRQLGGLLLLLGTCATFQPLASVSSLVGTGYRATSLAAGLIQIVFGSFSMLVGYMSMVHDYGDHRISGFLIGLTQFAWMPFIVDMVDVGKAASGPYIVDTMRSINGAVIQLDEYVENPFIPADYIPNERDVRFFGAMGILGIFAYGVAFLGSLAFTQFAIYAFDKGKPTKRDSRYYRSRLIFYTFMLVLAGLSQLLLGSYALFTFGSGPLEPSVGVAMYRISFPEISIAVGSLQMLVGYFGVLRYLGMVPIGPNDNQFQVLLGFCWFAMLVLEFLVQIGYELGAQNAALTPTFALLSLGLTVLPAFLDYKMRTLPKILTDEYFGATKKRSSPDSDYSPIKRALPETNSSAEQVQSPDIEAGVGLVSSSDSSSESKEMTENKALLFSDKEDENRIDTKEVQQDEGACKDDFLQEPLGRIDLTQATNQMYRYLENEVLASEQRRQVFPEIVPPVEPIECKDNPDIHNNIWETHGNERLDPSVGGNSNSSPQEPLYNSTTQQEPKDGTSNSLQPDPSEGGTSVEMKQFDPPDIVPLDPRGGNREAVLVEATEIDREPTKPKPDAEGSPAKRNRDDASESKNEPNRENKTGVPMTIQKPDQEGDHISTLDDALDDGQSSKSPLQISSEDPELEAKEAEAPGKKQRVEPAPSLIFHQLRQIDGLPDPPSIHGTSNSSSGVLSRDDSLFDSDHDHIGIELDISDDSSTPDDSTAVLQATLEEIEKEIFTESMGNFARSLKEIL